MFEVEANKKVKNNFPRKLIGKEILTTKHFYSRTNLFWGEHCTECAVPECYKTCSLYEATYDGRCRRFTNGMVKILNTKAANGYWLELEFKKWSKLEANGYSKMFNPFISKFIERLDSILANIIKYLPLPKKVHRIIILKYWGSKEILPRFLRNKFNAEIRLIFEIFNPEKTQLVTLKIFNDNDKEFTNKEIPIPFEKLLEIKPGYQVVEIPVMEIAALIDFNKSFRISFIPNNTEKKSVKLLFGLCDFIKWKNLKTNFKSASKIKCIIWDLDNTLWKGTLVEDGFDKLSLRNEVIDLIKILDKKGILNSIASKNNSKEALKVLKKFKIEKYFLCPQINWEPKSISIHKISQILNLSTNSFLFIDDQAFERAEVIDGVPGIRVRDEKNIKKISEWKEFKIPITETSKKRRKLYQEQAKRKIESFNFKNDYNEFLKKSEICLNISSLQENNFERVFELTQRTNQMNFSGTIYDKKHLNLISKKKDLECYVLSCNDKYGDYGIIGFCIFDIKNNTINDLMFSCRIQGKKIEHHFIIWLYKKQNNRDNFYVRYKPTERNIKSAQVFDDLGFELHEKIDEINILKLDRIDKKHILNLIQIQHVASLAKNKK